MELSEQHCIPCHTAESALSVEAAHALLVGLNDWKISEDGTWLRKSFTFPDFAQALAFVNQVGKVAETQHHHPDIALGWGYVRIDLQTHAAKGLHQNDFILAAKIDVL